MDTEKTNNASAFYYFCMDYTDEKLAAFLGREYLLECCVSLMVNGYKDIEEAKNDFLQTKTERQVNGK